MTTRVPIRYGGTGANTVAAARAALGVPSSETTNAVYAQANSAFDVANSAYGQANDAYAAANTRVLKSGDTMTGTLQLSLPNSTSISFQEQAGYGVIEIGGNSGAFIDMKAPASDDYDFRIQTRSNSNTQIHTNGTDKQIEILSNTSFNSGTLFVDTVNDRVGVGTIIPDQKLVVNGVIQAATTGNNGSLYLGGANVSIRANYSANVIGLYTTNSERMRITSTGNVGIGTSSPEGLISFPATASNTPKFRLQSAATNTDVAISSYADASGTYVSFGANHYFDSNGNDAVFETTDRSAYIALDARNSGAVIFGTNSSGIAAARARITAAGDLLVGTTNTSTEAEGFRFRKDLNAIASVSDGALAAYFGRLTSDGEIIRFRKDSTTIGSIGSEGGDSLYIGNLDAGLKFSGAADVIQPFNTSTVAARDAAISLGTSGARFKDLYLSGGVYLGGTTSANLLNDYEEGTWTPTYYGSSTAGTTTYVTQTGNYTKVGRQVTAICQLSISAATGTGEVRIGGLPFNAAIRGFAAASLSNVDFSGGTYVMIWNRNAEAAMEAFYVGDDIPNGNQLVTNEIQNWSFAITYFV
jgi:hypothetical protein